MPGARATPFEEASAADDLALVGLVGGVGGAAGGVAAGGGSSGRSSPTTTSSSGRSSPAMGRSGRPSPAVEHVAVQPLGELGKILGASTVPELERHTDATAEQADLFLNNGCTYDQIDRELAVALLSHVFDGHHALKVMEWEMVQDTVAGWGDDSDGFDELEEPGISGEALFEIRENFGVPSEQGRQERAWYVGGWPQAHDQTTAKLDKESRLLAEDYLPGRALAAAEGAGAAVEGAGARARSDGGPSRQAHGFQDDGNRGRKSRRNKNKAAEDGLDK